MQDLINDADELSYALNKLVPTIRSINTSYGEIYLDEQAIKLVEYALNSLYEKRFKKLERKNARSKRQING